MAKAKRGDTAELFLAAFLFCIVFAAGKTGWNYLQAQLAQSREIKQPPHASSSVLDHFLSDQVSHARTPLKQRDGDATVSAKIGPLPAPPSFVVRSRKATGVMLRIVHTDAAAEVRSLVSQLPAADRAELGLAGFETAGDWTAFEVQLENTGAVATEIAPLRFRLGGAAAERVVRHPDFLQAAVLPPGGSTEGFVLFRTPAKSSVSRVALQLTYDLDAP